MAFLILGISGTIVLVTLLTFIPHKRTRSLILGGTAVICITVSLFSALQSNECDKKASYYGFIYNREKYMITKYINPSSVNEIRIFNSWLKPAQEDVKQNGIFSFYYGKLGNFKILR